MKEKLVEKWLKEKLITESQSKKMVSDIEESKRNFASRSFITFLSILGAILLGIGFITLIASNWESLGDLLKVILFSSITLGFLYIGYFIQFKKKNYPKVGSSLIFLSAILFGADIYLIAQIYNVNVDVPVLNLIWLLGVLPLIYVLKSKPIAFLSSSLFLLWLLSIIFEFGNESYIFTYLIFTAVFLFSFGGLHYLGSKLNGVARVFRLTGIWLAMFTLFFYSFDDIYYYSSYGDNIFPLYLFLVIANFLMLGANFYLNPSKSENRLLENSVIAGILILPIITSLIDESWLLINLVLASLIGLLVWFGYKKQDTKLVSIGMFFTVLLVFAKYIELFSDAFDAGISFIVSGAILIGGGLFMERLRRKMKEKFKKQ